MMPACGAGGNLFSARHDPPSRRREPARDVPLGIARFGADAG